MTVRWKPVKTPSRVLIFRLGSLGDMLVALPALRLIRRSFPAATCRLLTNLPVDAKAPSASDVLSGADVVDGFLSYPVADRSPRARLRLWWSIVRWRPEVLIYLAAARGPRIVRRDLRFFRLCGIRQFIGAPLTPALQGNFFGADPRSPEALHNLDRLNLEPEAARLVRNLQDLGAIALEDHRSWDLGLTEAEHTAASSAIADKIGNASSAGLRLAVSLGTKVQAKDWGAKNWRTLLARLPALFPGYTLLLLGAKAEEELSAQASQAWIDAGGGPVANLCGRLTPRQSAAAIATARLFLGHDSGPMHLAAAVGTPVIAIFAARNLPRVWFPFGDRNRVLYHRTACSGCELEHCTVQRKRCLTAISVDQVLEAVRAVQSGRAEPPNGSEPVAGSDGRAAFSSRPSIL